MLDASDWPFINVIVKYMLTSIGAHLPPETPGISFSGGIS